MELLIVNKNKLTCKWSSDLCGNAKKIGICNKYKGRVQKTGTGWWVGCFSFFFFFSFRIIYNLQSKFQIRNNQLMVFNSLAN